MKLMSMQIEGVDENQGISSIDERTMEHHRMSLFAHNDLQNNRISNGNTVTQPRLPLFNDSEFIWRYGPLTLSSLPSSYPSVDFKNHLPNSIACDPRLWNKDDVLSFLRWCELEFDLPRFDIEMFQMNGKALCLLTKRDLGERCPGAGDLIYNVLRWLIRDAPQHHLPQSPVTPHFPLAPWWCVSMPPQEHANPTNTTAQPNSVTLSPAPSVDSQSSSPKQIESTTVTFSTGNTVYRNGVSNGTNSSGSNQSDSEVDDTNEVYSPISIPLTPSNTSSPSFSPRPMQKSSNQIFFPSNDPTTTSSEPSTNGRLLWDFLQQLLNDNMQRYTNYITWKDRDSGVFKIVDPPGLAKLWGIQKNHLSMNYDKMSRALRYYYRVNILRKVQGERHCYQFLRNPSELKSIKNISLLRQQISHSMSSVTVKKEPPEEIPSNNEIGPTDLSMNQNPTKLQSPSNIKEEMDRFRFPRSISASPMQLQVNMEARLDSDDDTGKDRFRKDERYCFPQDLTVNPNMQLQLSMEARSTYQKQLLENMPHSPNRLMKPLPLMKVEDA